MAKKLAATGQDVIDMGVGEPDFDTPKNIVEAGCNSIRMGETRYAPTAGIAELRRAIADKLARENSLHVTADDVTVTPGAKMAVFVAIQALLQEGDECVLIGPSWVSYEPCVAFAGGRVSWGEHKPQNQADHRQFSFQSHRLSLRWQGPGGNQGSGRGSQPLRHIR
jgi:aspartate aminotransferase